MTETRQHRERETAALAASRRQGHNLSREFFTDPGVHRRDVERLYLGHWIVAGHVASIPREGDYFLYDIGVESLIIVRGTKGSVHALANVCRHRGSRVAIEEYGHCPEFVCPLDGWVYALDGSLKSAPHARADFDRASHGLTRLAVEVAEGVIFVCLDSASNFDPISKTLRSFAAGHDLPNTRIAYHRRYLCPANWKLVLGTFFDLFTTGANFPEMRQVMAKAEAAASNDPDLSRRYDELSTAWLKANPLSCNAPAVTTATQSLDLTCLREPIRSGFITQSQDGAAIAPLLGNQSASDGGVTVIRLLASWIILCADYAVILRLTPLEAQVTEMDITWLVHASAVEGVDYDAPRLSWLWRANVERALKLASDNQLGVNSTLYRPGPFAENETELDAWTSWYLSQIA